MLLEEDLAGQAAEKGEYIKSKINVIKDKYPGVLTDITGRGLLLGMVFESDEVGFQVVSSLFKRGILIAGTLNNSQVVRIEPALNISYELLDKFLVELEEVIKSL